MWTTICAIDQVRQAEVSRVAVGVCLQTLDFKASSELR
jgi:hypothetical protein